eukprot:6181034-Pleurochrysis_carterae.AAC.1
MVGQFDSHLSFTERPATRATADTQAGRAFVISSHADSPWFHAFASSLWCPLGETDGCHLLLDAFEILARIQILHGQIRRHVQAEIGPVVPVGTKKERRNR